MGFMPASRARSRTVAICSSVNRTEIVTSRLAGLRIASARLPLLGVIAVGLAVLGELRLRHAGCRVEGHLVAQALIGRARLPLCIDELLRSLKRETECGADVSDSQSLFG